MDVPDGESAGQMPSCVSKGSAPLIPRVVELMRELLKRLQFKVGKCGEATPLLVSTFSLYMYS